MAIFNRDLGYELINIMLDEQDFACLVRGGVIHLGNLRIALKDIGFHVMDELISKADNGVDIYKGHVK